MQNDVATGNLGSRVLNGLLEAEDTVQSCTQIDWVLVVFKSYAIPRYVELPFSLSVFEVETADLGFPRV